MTDGGDGTIGVEVTGTSSTDGKKGGGGSSGKDKPRCRYNLINPQPPEDAGIWQLTGIDEAWTVGKLYDYVCPGKADDLRFLPNADAPVAADPTVLAERAVDHLHLKTPQINLSPKPPLKSYTALETWLWLPENQWQSLSTSVSAGLTTVTATARPLRVRWDMGDGKNPRVCTGVGREWKSHFSSSASTPCGYYYKKVSDFEPDGTYKIRAQIVYRVNWTCTGSCSAPEGTLGEVDGPQSGPVPIVVGERQSVVTTTK